jgi:signal transduction histidine kinase
VLDGIPVDGSFRSRHLAKDGSIRWLEWTARALWSDEVLVYSAARDITATVELNETRRLTEERLRSLTGQLLNAQEEERRRIARELHDSTTQELALVSAELAQLEKKAGPEQRADFVALRERLVAISEQVRVLAHDFHPGVLEHLGLTAALQAHCREVSQHSGIRVHFRPGPEVGKVPTSIATSLYRITQEALRNVAKHSGAVTATVMLSRLEPTPGKRVLRLAVIDDGKGFVMEKALNGSGLGLVSIEERARLVDGEMSIHSIPGEGTRVEVEVPLPTEEPSEE